MLADMSSFREFRENEQLKVDWHRHYKYFDDTINLALPNIDDWQEHQRVSYVRSANTWVTCEYPNPDYSQNTRCLE